MLYDPKTKQIYTPNTDSHAKIDDAGLQSGDEGDIITEKRHNDKHDEKGRFARKDGGAIKSVTVNDDGTVTTVYKPQAKTKYAPSPQRNHKGIQLDEREYNKVCSEFNSLNPGSKKGETDLVSKNGIRYFVESDGEGGITIYRAWEED